MENITASERLLQAVGLGYRPYEHSRDEFLGVLNSVDHPLYFGGELVEPAAKLVSAAQDTKLFDTFAAVYTPQEAEEAAQRIKADVRVAGYIRWPYGSEPLTIFHSGEDRLLRQYRINRGAGVRNGAGFLIYDPRESSELFEPKTTNLSARLMKDIGGIPGF